MGSLIRRFPLTATGTALLVAANLPLFLGLPDWPTGLQFTPERPLELQRWLGAHFVHLDREHFAWNGLAFLLLAPLVDLRAGRRAWGPLLLGLLLIGLGLLVLRPELGAYRGLSGLLFTFLGILVVEAWRGGQRGLAAGVLLLTLAKTAFELASGTALLAQGASPVPEAHLLGLAAGLMASVQAHRRAQLPPVPSEGVGSRTGFDPKKPREEPSPA